MTRKLIAPGGGGGVEEGPPGADGAPGPTGPQGEPGISVESGSVDLSGHLILEMSDDTTIDVGEVVGPPGPEATVTVITSSDPPSEPAEDAGTVIWIDTGS